MNLLRPEAVSEMTGIPIGTLAYWRCTGEGPKSGKLGKRRVVYREEDVRAWIDAQFNEDS